MKTYRSVLKESSEVVELRSLVESYEEIAATKMQKIREDIITSRDFYEGLSRLSKEVGVDFSLIHPEFTASAATVYISANAGLYGDIVEKTFFLFLDYIKKNQSDIYVVGKRGIELMRDYAPNVSYKTLDLSDDKVENDKFSVITRQLLAYKNIMVFYGKFKNVVTQNAASSAISGELLKVSESETDEKKMKLKFLYEPSLSKVSQIFGNEILASIFEAILRESQLAKFASRLMYLDSSLDKIDFKLKGFTYEMRKIKKRAFDKKQRLVVTGLITRGIT